jgi:hypothetical protein
LPEQELGGGNKNTSSSLEIDAITLYISPSWPLDPLGALVPEGSQEGGVRGGLFTKGLKKGWGRRYFLILNSKFIIPNSSLDPERGAFTKRSDRKNS